MDILNKKCVPCKKGLPPLSIDDVLLYCKDTPGWVVNEDNKFITRGFKFRNFVDSLDFVNLVGKIAEDEGHHPDISFGWGYCKIILQTHSIGGLHDNDFIVAAKIDKIYS